MILPRFGQTATLKHQSKLVGLRLMSIATTIVLLVPLANAQDQRYTFYVKDQQYRHSTTGQTFDCIKDIGSNYSSCGSRVADHHDFSMNFIEVNDDGDLWDDSQLQDALDQIDKARFNGQQRPIVFIYIHGWHNNAAERPNDSKKNCTDSLYTGDVAKFRSCGLPQIAEMYPPTVDGAPPRIVGIYMAWHGNDFNWPILIIIPSYPFRRYYAKKVGQLGMEKALDQIVEHIQQGHHRDDYYIITMGHSFGSRVLENATENVPKIAQNNQKKNTNPGVMLQYRAKLNEYSKAKASSALEAAVSNVEKPSSRPPVDLIFHVNAASSHSVSRATIADWKRICSKSDKPDACTKFHPIYFAVSSRADVVTAVVMPIANLVFFPQLPINTT